MKKTIAIILSIIMIACLTVPAMAADEDILNDSSVVSSEIDIETIISGISDAITEYYYSKDISGTFVADSPFKSEIAVYLSDKIDTQQYVTKLYNIDKENYNVDVSLKTYTEMSEPNILSFEFQVVTTYNYVGCSFETSSSELVKVLYDCTTDEIIDLYTPMNYYDEFVRGDQSVTGISSAVEGFDLTSSVIAKQDEIIKQIDSRYAVVNSSENSDISLSSVARTSSLDSIAIVNWARNNYNKDQPSSGKSSVPYFDFSEIHGAYDCTNFVSHAVLAGGANINDTGGSGISSTGWYYRNLDNRSSSWSGVNEFYQYLTTNNTYNTAAGISNIYTLNGAFWGIGNVMQFDFNNDGSYTHSTIITVKKKSNDGTRSYAYVTGRTGDGSYNNNVSAEEECPTGRARTILVYNV